MVSMEQSAKLSAGMSTTAAIAAIIAAYKSGKVAAGDLPEELMNLIIAMANNLESIDTDLDQVIAALSNQGIYWPSNTDSITSLRALVTPAGMQLPSVIVPSGMTLVLMGWPTNPAWLQIGASAAEAANINQSFPLLPGQVVQYQVQNANQIYVATAGAVAGCFICLTVEQRRAGGG